MRPTMILGAGCALMLSLSGGAAAEGRSLILSLENDVFTGTDAHYTSGLRAEFMGAEADMPAFAAPLLAALGPLTAEGARWRPLLGAANRIMTPPDITVSNPPLDERPYAGWLYAYAGLAAATPDRLDVFRAEIGVVGPPSGSEFAQKRLHEVIGSPRPLGWETLIGAAPTFALSWSRTDRFRKETALFGAPLELEALPHVRVTAGTVDSYAALGATFRIGRGFGGDFGPAPARIGASGAGAAGPAEGFGWSLYVGAEGRAVAHAGLIEGPLFGESRAAEARRFVGDLYFGGSLHSGAATLTYAHTIRSEEYKAQPATRQFGSHQFGALSLRIDF